MDWTQLVDRMPLVGASALIVYAMAVIIDYRRQVSRDRAAERRQWESERTSLIADRDSTIKYLRSVNAEQREKIQNLEDENRRLRSERGHP